MFNTIETVPPCIYEGYVVEFVTPESGLVMGVVTHVSYGEYTTKITVFDIFNTRISAAYILSNEDHITVTGHLSDTVIQNYGRRQ